MLKKDLSFFEFFVTILTSTSSFVISESPVIVILILTDSSLISHIKPRLERFLVNRSSSSSSTFLVTSNNIRRYAERFWLNIGLVSNVQSELPPEVIREIINRLHTYRDFIAAAGVSRTWRSVCLNISRRPHQLPRLMLSETLSTDMRHFFSLCDNNRHQLQLSEVQGKRCWGSPHGWVVSLGPDYETHLLHLIKRVQIPLPPLNTIRTLAATEEWFRLVHKFILLKDPSHELLFLVTAIFGPVNRLAFARVAFDGGEGAALNRRGQGQWAIVTNPDNLKFNDVACFNDQLYGLCDNGKLVCLELDAPQAAEVQVIAPGPSEEEIDTPLKVYLVGTSENLFGIFRYGDRNPLELRHGTTSFSVYKFDFRASAWKEVIDLEDLAVFVGDGNSWCIPTSTILCRSNCIYFTDDNWEWQRYPGVAYGGHDVGVFNMAQTERVIQRLPFGKNNPLFYSRPIWVTPTLR